MINFLKKYKYIFISGLLSGLAFPPFYFIIFLPITFYYLLNTVENLSYKYQNEDKNLKKIIIFLKSPYFRESFLYGLIFGFGYFLTQLYWISFSLLIDIKTYFWLFPLAIIIIPFLCSIYFAFSVVLTSFLIKYFSIKNRFLISITFSFAYIIFEYLKGIIFPWNLFSYILAFSDILIQSVYLINIYLLNFIILIFCCFGFVIFDYKNKKLTLIKNNLKYIYVYTFILLFMIFFGLYRLHNSNIKYFNLNFRLVQANIPQTVKWEKNEIDRNLQKYKNLTTSNGFEDIDIIVWSESSIPYILPLDLKLANEFNYLENKILISGALRGELENNKLNKLWNTIFIFKNNEIIDYYDKFILVPFGEYIPFSKYIPFVKKITEGYIDFSKGSGNKTIFLDNISISPIICYEIVFKNNVIDKNNIPDLIINLTNDAWFGNSSGPYQHLVSAKFRAIENKIAIIRVSNSGISAYIDEYGRIKNKLSIGKDGILDIRL